MKIIIETIPASQHRYPTSGDYFWDKDGTLQIKISECSDSRYEEAIAIHELVEALLCKNRNIKEEDITAFDIRFEENSENSDKEPGDDPNAPYANEHCVATAVERLYIASLGLSWKEYDNSLTQE